jgi:hypothetical protein
MANQAKRTRTQRQAPVDITADATTTEPRTIPYLDLAAEAVIDAWTREQVVAALISRVKRDQGYLAYRKACNRRTSYDIQVQQDIRALSLAAVWLGEGKAN